MGSEGWAWAGDVTQCCPRGGHDSAVGHVGRTSRGVTYSLTVPALFGSCLRPLSLQEDKQRRRYLNSVDFVASYRRSVPVVCTHTHTFASGRFVCTCGVASGWG